MTVAVLLTCYNRKKKTLSCLNSLYEQSQKVGLTCEIFLVDDGSTDGTSSAVRSSFPEVNILNGCGSLYWNRGMDLAWKTAAKKKYSHYLWVNDDVVLSPNAFYTIFESFRVCSESHGTDPVIVGSFSETDSQCHAYGGFRVKKNAWGITKTRILPGAAIKECDTFNGNLVLIPDSVFQRIGFLDGYYTHSFGDIDYGNRCKANKIPMYIAPGYVGECPRNSTEGSWSDPNVSISERYKRLVRPTGLPPAEYFYSYKKDCTYFAGGLAVLKLYLKLLFPKLWSRCFPSKGTE